MPGVFPRSGLLHLKDLPHDALKRWQRPFYLHVLCGPRPRRPPDPKRKNDDPRSDLRPHLDQYLWHPDRLRYRPRLDQEWPLPRYLAVWEYPFCERPHRAERRRRPPHG